jgi:hypothetical protein
MLRREKKSSLVRLTFGEADRHEAASLLSARATGNKIESDDRSSVQVKGAVSDCQPNFALSANFCAPFRLLP